MGQDIRQLFSSSAAKRSEHGAGNKLVDLKTPSAAKDVPRDVNPAARADQVQAQGAKASPALGAAAIPCAEPMVIDLLEEDDTGVQQQQDDGPSTLPFLPEPVPATPAPAPKPEANTHTPAANITANKTGKGAKTPADAATVLSAEEKAQLKAACLEEMPVLEQELRSRPDLCSAAAQHAATIKAGKVAQTDLKHEVALLVEGRSEGLSSLAALVAEELNAMAAHSQQQQQQQAADDSDAPAAGTSAGNGTAVTVLMARNLIQEVSTRKSYGLLDATRANLDAMEDESAEHCWCWEVRDIRLLAKGARALAEPHRKHRKALQDRLRAVAAFVEAASVHGSSKAVEGKVARAAAKMRKLQGLEALREQLRAAVEAAADKAAAGGKRAAKPAMVIAAGTAKAATQADGDQAPAREAEPAIMMEQTEAASQQADAAAPDAQQVVSPAPASQQPTPSTLDKAAAKAQKEEEHARKEARARKAEEKAKRDAEREEEKRKKEEERRQREAEKEAEKARKKEEKARKAEAAELGKHGFKSKKQLQASRNRMMSFVIATPAGKCPQSNSASSLGGTDPAGAGCSAACSAGGAGAGAGGGGGSAQLQGATPGSKRVRQAMEELDADIEAVFEQRASRRARLEGPDGATGRGAGTGEAPEGLCWQEEILESWRRQRGAIRRTKGLPPPYARRPGAGPATFDLQAAVEAVYGEGADIGSVRLWRRKLIKHWDSERPAYYGSWSRPCTAACGRRPLGKDPELDYSVMSDEEWEEEPEGESLSDDAGDCSEGPEEVDESEGEEGEFVVKDGYLSEDEGCRDDGAAAEGGGDDAGPMQVDRAAAAGPLSPRTATLLGAMERARRAHRPLLLCSLDTIQCQPTSGIDPGVLSCLKGQLLRTDILPLQPPADPWETPPGPASEPPPAAARGAAGLATPGAAAPEGVAHGGGSGARSRRAAQFPQELMSSLIGHVHRNAAGMAAVVAAFITGHPGHELPKACVERTIRQITLPRRPGFGSTLLVRPELLQEEGAAGEACAAAAPAHGGTVGADEAPSTPQAAVGGAPTDSRPDAQPPTCELQQQAPLQQQDKPAGGGGGGGNATSLPAAAAATAAAAAASGQPAPKRQKTAAVGIERFFKSPGGPRAGGGTQALAAAADALGLEPNQQQEQQQPPRADAPELRPDFEQAPAAGAAAPAGAGKQEPLRPPQPLQGQQQQQQQQPRLDLSDQLSTPKGVKLLRATESGCPASMGAGSAALPLLTPPSNEGDPGSSGAPQGRAAEAGSPIPFRLMVEDEGAAGAGAAAGKAPRALKAPRGDPSPAQGEAAATPTVEGRGGGGGSVSPGGGGGVVELAPPSMFGWRKSPEGQTEWQSPSVPAAPEDVAAQHPGHMYWKQLAHWVVTVKGPSAEDTEAAFAIFNEAALPSCVHQVPQRLASSMVKTLGAPAQSPVMRAACARCLSHLVVCLSRNLEPGADADAGGGPAAAAAAPAAQAGAAPVGAVCGPGCCQHAACALTGPPTVSIEEICLEPDLLPNLYHCLKAGNEQAMGLPAPPARAGAGPAEGLHGGGGAGARRGAGGAEEAAEMAEAAARCVAALVTLGVHNPFVSGAPPEPPAGFDQGAGPSGAHPGGAAGDSGGASGSGAARGVWSALCTLRSGIARDKRWRGVLKTYLKAPPQLQQQQQRRRREAGPEKQPGAAAAALRRRQAYALMALHGVLGAPAGGLVGDEGAWRLRGAAAGAMVPTELLARRMLADVLAAAAGAEGNKGVCKWALAVAVDLLSLPHAAAWLLPRKPLAPAAPGNDELLQSVDDGARLAVWALDRDAAPGSAAAHLQLLGARLASAVCGYVGYLRRAMKGAAPARAAAAIEVAEEWGDGQDLPSLVSVLQRLGDGAPSTAPGTDPAVSRACAGALWLLVPPAGRD